MITVIIIIIFLGFFQGAKLFYLSGLVYGSYPKVEIHNLGRFISVTKFRPLTWRVSHPYMLADRYKWAQTCKNGKYVH